MLIVPICLLECASAQYSLNSLCPRVSILINIPDAQVRNLRIILDVIKGDQEKAPTDHQLGL